MIDKAIFQRFLAIMLGGAALVLFAAGVNAARPAARPMAKPLVSMPCRPAVQKEARAKLSQTPLYFEPNAGQTDPEVLFLARGGGFVTFLTGKEAVFVNSALSEPLRLRFVGSAKPSAMEPGQRLPGISNYFKGKDPAKWRTNVPHYSSVRFREVYEGVDVLYYSGKGRIEYDLIVRPGADPSRIELAWSGTSGMRIDTSGDLVLATSAGEVRQHRPIVYQHIDGQKVAVNSSYRKTPVGTIGIELAAWDRRHTLVIDPIISSATFVGGSALDDALGITVDPGGAAYLAGYTQSTNYPLQSPIQNQLNQFTDVVVTKLSTNGDGLVYSTYLGGGGEDRGVAVAADVQGNAYITGFAASFDYPTTAQAYQRDYSGLNDSFVTKLSPFGNQLLLSTFLGPDGSTEIGYAIGIDYAGNVVVTGTTTAVSFPTTPGAFNTTYGGAGDIFVTKFNPTLSQLVFSTYVGGVLDDTPSVMVVDHVGEIFIAGFTASPDFPTTVGAYSRTQRGLADAFVFRLRQDGKQLVFSTMIGGANSDSAAGLTLEPGGRIVIAGTTESLDFPTTVHAFSRTMRGVRDAFVAKFDSTASTLLVSTLIGTPQIDAAIGVRMGEGGYPIIAGYTESNNFHATADAFGFGVNFQGDAFVTIFRPLGNALLFSSVYGGPFIDQPRAMSMDANGDIYVTGLTNSTGFPTTPGAFDGSYNGGFADIFAFRVSSLGVFDCISTISTTGTAFPKEGGGGGIGMSDVPCVWNAVASVPWVTLLDSPLSQGAGSLNYTVGSHNGADPRTAAVQTAGNLIHLIQKGTTVTSPFVDVPAADPFAEHIRIIKNKAVTNGCSPTEFCPNANTTRAQMAVFIVRSVLGTDDFTFPAAPYFQDVASTHPMFKWIQKLRQLGITQGCNLIHFCPEDPVTRGQMAAFIIRAKFGTDLRHSTIPYFSDVPPNHIFFAHVQKLRQFGITTGCSATQFCVDSFTTRGQMAVFLTRAFFTPW
jgi:hypothetical protein